MLLLIAAAYACIELREQYPKGDAMREALKSWHYTLGISIFLLAWARILFRMFGPTLRAASNHSVQNILAKAMHVSLYVLMVGTPVLGYLILSAEQTPIPFFGMELPWAIPANRDLAKLLEEVHETLGTIGYILIGGHAVAALFHHYVKHDDTLVRMLPRRPRQ